MNTIIMTIKTLGLAVSLLTGNITTYNAVDGFNQNYEGQAYVDTDVMKVCYNEDCSQSVGLK